MLMSKLRTPTEHQQLHQDTDLSHADQRWCSAAAEMSNMQLVAGEEVSRQLAARYSLRSADNRPGHELDKMWAVRIVLKCYHRMSYSLQPGKIPNSCSRGHAPCIPDF